mgnify:CR=1 FL=1
MKSLDSIERRIEKLEEQARTKADDALRQEHGIGIFNFSRSPEEAAEFERRFAACPPHLRPRQVLHVKIWPGSWKKSRDRFEAEQGGSSP